MPSLPLFASALLALATDPLPALDLTPVAPIEAPHLKLRPETPRDRPTPLDPERWPGLPGLWALGPILPRTFSTPPRNGPRRLIAPMPQVVGDENLDRRMPMKGPDPDVDYKILMREVPPAPSG